jgi:hypothetical protein
VTRKEIFGTVTQEETNGCLQMEIPLPFPRELSERVDKLCSVMQAGFPGVGMYDVDASW